MDHHARFEPAHQHWMHFLINSGEDCWRAVGPILIKSYYPTVIRQGTFRFDKQSDGSWVFNELMQEWALQKDRAQHADNTHRDTAAL